MTNFYMNNQVFFGAVNSVTMISAGILCLIYRQCGGYKKTLCNRLNPSKKHRQKVVKLIKICQKIQATNNLFYNLIQNFNVETYFVLSSIKKRPLRIVFLFKTTQTRTDIIIGFIFR